MEAMNVPGSGPNHETETAESRTRPSRSQRAAGPTGIEKMVCDDIAERQRIGIKKYGMPLADNKAGLRARLQHAYEETLDHANYLKWAMEELGDT